MRHITTVDEFKELLDSSSKIIIDFYATWCGPCKMLTPIIEDLANTLTDIAIVKVDVDQADELSSMFGIYSVPTVAYIKDKTLVLRKEGFQPKDEILANIQKVF